jgi:hypothetical protein
VKKAAGTKVAINIVISCLCLRRARVANNLKRSSNLRSVDEDFKRDMRDCHDRGHFQWMYDRAADEYCQYKHHYAGRAAVADRAARG